MPITSVINELSSGIRTCESSADRFKTNVISVAFALPLSPENASVNALIPNLLSRVCKEYPDLALLNKRLSELYGAILHAVVTKIGEAQIMHLSLSFIDDKYALFKDKPSIECANLLYKLIFEPSFEDGIFLEKDIEREKRLLSELIDSEFNEKRLYAAKRCEELMFDKETYGTDRLGSKELLEKITPRTAYEAWLNILKTARIQINIIGQLNSDPIISKLNEGFKHIGREETADCSTQVWRTPPYETVRQFEDKMSVSQGKLVLGFRAGICDQDESSINALVMNDLYGGGPYSRLFMNVREKLSLCYYCSSRYYARKGVFFVNSGVENENMEKAIEEIKLQLNVIRDGSFSDQELSASKLSLEDFYNSSNDTPWSVDRWYTNQIFKETPLSTSDYAKLVASVTREQVSDAAQKASLDTIYMLTSI